MKKIIINGNHAEKLAAELYDVQKHCQARTLTVREIECILEETTQTLNISKKALKGTILTYTGAETFPSAYKYKPESTHFKAECNGRYWVVSEIFRDTCPNRCVNTGIELSDSAKEALTKRSSFLQL